MTMMRLLLIACTVGASTGMSYVSTSTGNEIFVNGLQINIVTEPQPKLYVNGESVNLTEARGREEGQDFTLYTGFSRYPGLSVKYYNNGGYTVYYDQNGVVSKFGTLSEEEQRQLNQQLAQTFQHVNQQISQVQQQVGNMMQSLTNMFNRPGWPFVR